MKSAYRYLFGTLRGRLIIGVAAVLAVVMTLLIFDFTSRQRAMLLDRQVEEAIALSHTLATSAAGWIASDDISGMQELVEAQRRYPEMVFAMLADREGRVLADIDKSRTGQYLLDLPAEERQVLLSRSAALVDVVTPAMLGGRHVGWARVGIGQKVATEKLAQIERSSLFYALAAILAGSMIAWLLGLRITSRLYAVQKTIDAVRAGDRLARSSLIGDDEAAVIAREFNAMLDALSVRDGELRASEERLRSLICNVQAAIVLHDGTGQILDSNPMAQELLDLSADQLLGRDLLDPGWHFLKEDGSPMSMDEYPASLVLASRQPVRGYVSGIRRRDRGDVAWVLVNAEPEFDAGGEMTGVLVSFVDITEQKRAKEELMKLFIAVEQSPVSIVITDKHGTIEYVNPRFIQLTGYERSEVVGENTRIFKSGETAPGVYQNLWKTLADGKVWQGEFHNKKKNGELFWEAATISPMKNSEGAVTHYIAIKEDVTERKKLETQLLQAQKMEAVGILAGGVAHDFNNILTVIIGFGSLLEMKMSADDPQYHNVSQILAAADRAANLTRSLLAFSRKQSIEMKVTDLNDIVTGLEKMLRRLIREDIELTITPTGRRTPVLVDGGQIEQVLINLAANARDAMPGGGTLTINICETTLDDGFTNVHGYGEAGEYALIVVADDGMGMAEDVRTRVFDPFFTTKEVGKGTGLGLSVCYGIVKQHGGYINCYSEPGRGTTFRIYLPLAKGEAEEMGQTVTVPVRGGTETLLLAEDDPAVRELTANILKQFGYTVVEACDGEEAVARFREGESHIDFCLFDVIMPKMRGWEAYETVRTIRPDIRALFMSGYQVDMVRLDELAKTGSGFIAKPVVPRELLRKVRELLDG